MRCSRTINMDQLLSYNRNRFFIINSVQMQKLNRFKLNFDFQKNVFIIFNQPARK